MYIFRERERERERKTEREREREREREKDGERERGKRGAKKVRVKREITSYLPSVGTYLL